MEHSHQQAVLLGLIGRSTCASAPQLCMHIHESLKLADEEVSFFRGISAKIKVFRRVEEYSTFPDTTDNSKVVMIM